MLPVPRSLVVLAVTPALLALPVVSRPAPKPHPVPPVVREHAAGVGVGAPRRVQWFSAIGLTWARGSVTGELDVAVRVRQAGRWQDWHPLDADDEDAPDDTSPERGSRGGSALYYTGPADGYQVRVTSGSARDVRVALIDPGSSDADSLDRAVPSNTAYASANQPAVVTRAQWGADERLRSGSPSYADTIKVGFVHHTDTTNSYSASQSAALVRSVYAFHTRSRGWSDIGYNFLVDKYGRLFEGRYGGIARPVIGAHTGGFNTGTFGVSLLGNYTSVGPAGAQLAMLERVFAWKFGLHYVNPLARTTLTSAGGSKYAAGVRVTFNNVSAHRDAGLTACPGSQTYVRMPSIRSWDKAYMGASIYYPSITTAAPLYLTTPSVTMRGGIAKAQYWRGTVVDRRTGELVKEGSGNTASPLVWTWNLRYPSGDHVPPGSYRLTMESWVVGNRARPYVVDVQVRSPLPSGLVVRDLSGVVSILDNGRRAVPSPALLAALRPPDLVVPAWPTQLAPYAGPVAPLPDGAVVRTPDGAAWAIVDGIRRPISGGVYDALGLPPAVAVSAALAAVLPAGPALTDRTRHPDGQLVTDGLETWRLESGVRRPFTSAAALDGWSTGRALSPATSADLALPAGPPLGPPEGTLLRTGVVSGGTFRPFPSPEVATGLGYAAADAPEATSADLAALGTGPALGAGAHPSGTLLRDGSAYWEVWGSGRRWVDPALLAVDPRRPVLPVTGEMAALGASPYAAPAGFAGRGADGVVRVVAGGRLVVVPAGTLGYSSVALPALEAADFGVPVAGSLVNGGLHPSGSIVFAGSETWLLDAGARRQLTDAVLATYLGRPVLPATAADLARPAGGAAPPATGSWLRVPGDGSRWLVEHGVRRSVSPAVAHRLGLDQVAPLDVPLADLAAGTISGSPVP